MKAGEATCMAFIVQGGLLAAAHDFVRNVRQPVKIVQPSDAEGIYEQHFFIELASGIVLRVAVTVESEARR